MAEGIGRVIAAAGFALVAGGSVEFEAAGVGVDARVHFQQTLIDAAEFFRAEILVVHRAADIAILNKSNRLDGFEEVAIGDKAVEQIGRGLRRRPQETAQGRQREFRAAGVAAEFGGDELEDVPEIWMRRARAVERERPQARDGIEIEIAAAGFERGFALVRHMEERPVLRDQLEQHPVYDTQNLAVKFLGGQLAGAQFFAERGIARMRDQSRSQSGDGPFDAGVKIVEGAQRFILGRFFPTFEPILRGLLALKP